MSTHRLFLRIFSFATVALLLLAASAVAAPKRDPSPHLDGVDASPSPLDLRSVAFGQRGIELVMQLKTAGEWEAAQLSPALGRALCVKLYYGNLRTPRSQICVIDRSDPDEESEPGLIYSRLDPFGAAVENRRIAASISRPDKSSLEAVFEPSSANLGLGRYSWQAVSTWSCGAPGACEDRLPSNGNVIARMRPLAEPRCFGAAARNPGYACFNRQLRLSVLPTPEQAVLEPNARCPIVSRTVPYTCGFGVRRAIADRTIALVGDSHAAHWRGALEVVAQARRWRGYSLTRAGCPLSTATPDLDRGSRRSCAAWRRAVRRWFRRHPEVRTVFVSQIAGARVRRSGGRSGRESQVRGFMRAWSQLPRTVKQIIVLRDTPTRPDRASVCVQQAVLDRERAGINCAISRKRALPGDRAVVAARRTRNKRVHVIDLTDHMCSRRRCFPVVGGVLVHKDTTHITPLFSTTLGPFVLKRVERLLG